MSRIFPDLLILFAFILLMAWALTFLKGKSAIVLASPKVIYIFLILWTFVGFLFVLDNSMRYGCLGVSVSQPIGLGYSIIHLPTEGV
ncbi:MAG: hypothetical protein HOP30_15100 [Cyclobacteriaceae bacterium]|nr:hypothetical protein [Cyclobacteriaceae bacterium]